MSVHAMLSSKLSDFFRLTAFHAD